SIATPEKAASWRPGCSAPARKPRRSRRSGRIKRGEMDDVINWLARKLPEDVSTGRVMAWCLAGLLVAAAFGSVLAWPDTIEVAGASPPPATMILRVPGGARTGEVTAPGGTRR